MNLEPFPNDINRDTFGWYISGFTDGEGCFSLFLSDRVRSGRKKQARPTPSASFALNLRKDDDGILKLIQSYFQCGSLIYGGTTTQCTLRFRKLSDLAVIVEHFDKFNLFAKKKEDFKIWKQAVGLMCFVSERSQKRSQRYGSSYKWGLVEHDWFSCLKKELSEGRKLKVCNEKNCLRDPAQPHLVLDPNLRSVVDEEPPEG